MRAGTRSCSRDTLFLSTRLGPACGARCFIFLREQAANPPVPKFFNVSGLPHNTIHANDFHFFGEVNEIVQEEPAESLDPETLGLLASIGIEKGKPFAPDARMKKILVDAAR